MSLLLVEKMVRDNASAVIADPKSSWRANVCAGELFRALTEIAVLTAQVKAKDEQLAEMSSLWREIRKAEAA